MKYTRIQAEEKGHAYGFICSFHLHNPDQQVIMESCTECIYIDEDEEQKLEDGDIRQ